MADAPSPVEEQQLKDALDEIRERFGPDAVRRAAGLKSSSNDGQDE